MPLINIVVMLIIVGVGLALGACPAAYGPKRCLSVTLPLGSTTTVKLRAG